MRKVLASLVAGTLVLATLAGPAAASGPGTWVYNPATRHSYAQVDGVTWADAETLAVNLGGHLARQRPRPWRAPEPR